MATAIVPLTDEYLDGAAALLAARHRRDRQQAPALPARFDDPAAARDALRDLLAEPGGRGVVAVRAGRPVGFLVGAPRFVPATGWVSFALRPRAAEVAYAGHAVDPEQEGDLYRALYAALAAAWVDAGLYAHYVAVPAADRQALDAWFALGFGCLAAYAARGTDPDSDPVVGTSATIRRAGPADLDAVMPLVEDLWRYHAGSPIFWPFSPETAADRRAYNERTLADPTHAYWLAERDGRPVGLQTFEVRQVAGSPLATPERCVVLLQAWTVPEPRGSGVGRSLLRHGLAWAREAGHESCAVPYGTANPIGARFWPSQGFRPLVYRLCRVVDDRVAWSDGREETAERPRP